MLSGFDTLEYCLYLKYFGGLVLLILEYRSIKILRICAVYSEYEKYFRPSPHRFDNFIPFFGRKLSQTVLRVLVGANYFRGERLEYLSVPAILREYLLRVPAVFRSGFCTTDTLSSISGFDTADTPVLAVRNVLDTPSILEVRSILGASMQYCTAPSTCVLHRT